MPVRRGRWTATAAAQARVVARMRERGYSLEDLKDAGREGRLAFGFTEELFAAGEGAVAARGRRRGDRAGAGADRADPRHPRDAERSGSASLSPADAAALRHCARVLAAGLPLVAFLQLVRVYVQSMRRIADAEVRLFHLYVHEPLIRDAVPGAGDGGGDGRPRRRHPAAGGAADRVPAHPLPALLRRAGRGRPHGVGRPRHGRNRARPGPRSRSASSTSPGSPATPRRRATSRRSTWSRTSSPRSRRRCRARRRS